MTGYSNILDILRNNNPFASDSVSDPWDDVYPSVATIHARAYQELSSLITQKANLPTLAIGALILGEAGSGKTHLIKRIIEAVHKANRPLLMAYVQPIENTQFPFTYLLKEIVNNLRRPLTLAPNSPTQLDRLLSKWLMEHFGPQISALSPAMSAAIQNNPERILSLNLTALNDIDTLSTVDLPKPLRKILPHYQRKELRRAVVDWLAGEALDHEYLEILQLPDRLSISVEAKEAEALELLIAIGELLARYQYCLIVCFDRWENLETPTQIKATGRMVGELFDRIQGMLPMIFARSMDWDERLIEHLNQHITSRIENNRFSLSNCDKDNAIALIKSRLNFALKDAADGIEPFTQEQINAILRVGSLSPRMIISLANNQLRSILNDSPLQKEISVADVLLEEFNTRYQYAVTELNQSSPDKGRLQRAFQVLLNGVSKISIQEPKSPAKEKYDLLLKISDQNNKQHEIALIIDLEQHHSAVSAAIDRGLHHLTTTNDRQVVYMRDGRHPIPLPPKWPATNEKRDKLEQHGALLWTLNAEQTAGWYALADLAYAIKSGDVTLIHDGRLRTLTYQELTDWTAVNMRNHPAFVPLWDFLGFQAKDRKT
jgi:Cdc6-like AAA superfamily ATPase